MRKERTKLVTLQEKGKPMWGGWWLILVCCLCEFKSLIIFSSCFVFCSMFFEKIVSQAALSRYEEMSNIKAQIYWAVTLYSSFLSDCIKMHSNSFHMRHIKLTISIFIYTCIPACFFLFSLSLLCFSYNFLYL